MQKTPSSLHSASDILHSGRVFSSLLDPLGPASGAAVAGEPRDPGFDLRGRIHEDRARHR